MSDAPGYDATRPAQREHHQSPDKRKGPPRQAAPSQKGCDSHEGINAPGQREAPGGLPGGPVRIFRGRPERFTSIPNPTVDDARLDVLAVGLLTIILRCADGWQMSVDEIARRRGPDRRKLYAAMRTLVDCGYVVKVKYQDGRGRWQTDVYTFDTPADPAEVADLLQPYRQHRALRVEPAHLAPGADPGRPVDNPDPTSQRLDVGDDLRKHPSETVNQQVAPTSRNRQVGNRQAGFREAKKKTVTKTVTKTEELPSFLARETSGADPAPRREGGEAPESTKHVQRADTRPGPSEAVSERLSAAQALVDELPRGDRVPSRGEQRRLVEAVAAALAGGWPVDALRRYLTDAPGRDPWAVYAHRLRPTELPDPPAPRSRPRENTCRTHPGSALRADGECAGCWADRIAG